MWSRRIRCGISSGSASGSPSGRSRCTAWTISSGWGARGSQLGGANLDPRHVPHPEVLDITREEREHLAFGHGIHLCLGAPLARLEGQIAFGTLLRRLPGLRLDVEPDRLTYHFSGLRSLVSLPVAF
ncbi:hypothetical protein DLM86_24480 [Paenibacillus flagellatus]|uniref:Cytochrome P450 n=1 Tax=Paenibacillus flagellatus TaxID=2211139 RepID=A0A2V5K218_9BACL|nr:hypothetical protein DLM86_24480 [Paenibacillus flagellatus]